ncbi:MAG TPA: TIM barrel protein [Actinomycetota bacterium]|nr:TIM barrel protein [Actinomycetota bacterium]
MSRRVGRVAGAPISWGVCEVPGWGHQLEPDRVLSEMAGLGLPATELGPDGYLPTDASRLEATLGDHGLALVAGFVPAVLHEPARLEDELDRVTRQADLLAGAGAQVLVLAAGTGRDGYEAGTELDDPSWASLVAGIARVIDLGSQRGLAVALHPHQGTVIEGPHQVQRLLESSPVSLCVDTGHLLVGGVDPVELTKAAPDRVAHVHLKDVSVELAEQVRTGWMGYREAVAKGMYRPLGSGDVDIAAIISALEASDYDGWYVLEQDTVLEGAPEEGSGPVHDVAASLAFVERFGVRLGPSSVAGVSVSEGGHAMERRPGGKEGE